MRRHEERAQQFRSLADAARERSLAAGLPRVRETHDRSAATWDALASLEEAMIEAAARRTAALPPVLAPA